MTERFQHLAALGSGFGSLARMRGLLPQGVRVIPVLCVLLVLGLTAPAGGAGREMSEKDFKVGFAYKFALLTTWPESSLEERADFRMCILDDEDLTDRLEAITEGKTTQGMPVRVANVSDGTAAGLCHILFIPGSRGAEVVDDLRALRGHPVLTVSDGESFIDRGGMIQLVQGGSSLRFMINRYAAVHSSLTISARVLRLATRVIDTPGDEQG